MYENLGMLAFIVLIVGQFAAVIAVHGWRATNHLMNDEGRSPAPRNSKNGKTKHAAAIAIPVLCGA